MSNNTSIKTSPGKGRGVFANRSIQIGELIETAHVIVIPNDEITTTIDFYVFTWLGETSAIALGTASLYNHSNDPNVAFVRDYDNGVITFAATRDIEEGEELYINYGYEEDEMLLGDAAKKVHGEKL